VAAKVCYEISEQNFNMHWVDVDIGEDMIHGKYDEKNNWQYGILYYLLQQTSTKLSQSSINMKEFAEQD